MISCPFEAYEFVFHDIQKYSNCRNVFFRNHKNAYAMHYIQDNVCLKTNKHSSNRLAMCTLYMQCGVRALRANVCLTKDKISVNIVAWVRIFTPYIVIKYL